MSQSGGRPIGQRTTSDAEAGSVSVGAPWSGLRGTGQARRARTGEVLREARSFALRPTRRNFLHWGSWALALGVELALAVVLRNGRIYGWEQAVARRLQEAPGKRVIFDVSSTLTNTLSVPFLLLFLVIVSTVLLVGHRGAALLLLLSFPLHVLAQFPKALVDRPRPSPAFDGIEGVGGLQSFPSGHSEYVVTFYGFLAYLLMLRVKGRWSRVAIAAGWGSLALATGFGRVAEGRHWPLDVLASYLIGLGLLSGMIWLHSAFRYTKPGGPRLATGHGGRGRFETWPGMVQDVWGREVAIVGGLAAAFVTLLLVVECAAPTSFDRRLAGQIQSIPWGEFGFVPRLGSDLGGVFGFYVLPAIVAVAFVAWRQWRLLALLAAVFVLHFVLIAPKLFVAAQRPSPEFGVEGGGGLQSFPSGHVQWTASFYGFLAYLAWRVAPARLRVAVVPVYAGLVLATMLGRIEVGRHWPVDTLGGVLAGLIALRLVVVADGRARVAGASEPRVA